MSTTTTNLGLVKPSYSDAADIAAINSNMDLIDAAMAKKVDIGAHVNAANISANADNNGDMLKIAVANDAGGSYVACFSFQQIEFYDRNTTSTWASYPSVHVKVINNQTTSGGGNLNVSNFGLSRNAVIIAVQVTYHEASSGADVIAMPYYSPGGVRYIHFCIDNDNMTSYVTGKLSINIYYIDNRPVYP